MSNTLLLCYSPKPRSQVRILIYPKWSIRPRVIYHELVCYDLKTDGSYRPLKTLQLLYLLS